MKYYIIVKASEISQEMINRSLNKDDNYRENVGRGLLTSKKFILSISPPVHDIFISYKLHNKKEIESVLSSAEWVAPV